MNIKPAEGGGRGEDGHRNINTRQTWRPGVIDPVIGDPLMQILRPSSPFAPSLPPFSLSLPLFSLPPFPSLRCIVTTRRNETAYKGDRRSRNPRAAETSHNLRSETPRLRKRLRKARGPPSGFGKTRDNLPVSLHDSRCLAIIGEHRRERASRKSQRGASKRAKANEGKWGGGRRREGEYRERKRRRERKENLREREREKRRMEKMKNCERRGKRKGEEKEGKRGKIS